MKRIEEVAQAMLDGYGFFVLCSRVPLEVGSVSETKISAGYMRGRYDSDEFFAKYKVLATASEDDIAKQYALAGELPTRHPGLYLYRAVAE